MLSDEDIIAIYLKHNLRFQNPPALQAAVDTARAIESAARAEAIEQAAVAAWNHYMETTQKNFTSATAMQQWLASGAIRALKETK